MTSSMPEWPDILRSQVTAARYGLNEVAENIKMHQRTKSSKGVKSAMAFQVANLVHRISESEAEYFLAKVNYVDALKSIWNFDQQCNRIRCSTREKDLGKFPGPFSFALSQVDFKQP